MTILKHFVVIALLFSVETLLSQEQRTDCQDVVYLKGGSILRGKIQEYNAAGNLIMTSWSGAQMQVPSVNVKRVVQRCKGDEKPRTSFSERPYTFQETGWYNATRFSVLSGESGDGVGLQHSFGKKTNRTLGIGAGLGIENFAPYEGAPTYPVFAELRGYLSSKKISPFYALGAGYGFSKRVNNSETAWDGAAEKWRGGWMAQGQIGYRIGNHVMVHFGIRLQHKTRTWSYPWTQISGQDQILHKRLDIGIGLLL